MKRKVLVTGGAGFVGSHLADELVAHGHEVRVLDNLSPRVHVPGQSRRSRIRPEVEWIHGDVRDGAVLERALQKIEIVVHLAAAVEVGDSLFEAERCVSVNYVGTAVLIDALRRFPVERLVVGSTMAVYGEGLYRDARGVVREAARRTPDQLQGRRWEPEPGPLVAGPTPETKAPCPQTVYGRSKLDQERICWRFGQIEGMPTTILRFFNTYGPGQSPSSPYTAELASAVELLVRGRRPLLPEDGGQRRDFVHVRDVVAACRRAIEVPVAPRGVFNVGSGEACSVASAARLLAELAGHPELAPQATGRFDFHEVRHCFADVERAEQRLGHRSKIALRDGFAELVEWARANRPLRAARVVAKTPVPVAS